MTAWLRAHLDALRDALTRLAAAPLNAVLSLLVIGIALALPAAGLVALDNLQNIGSRLAGNHEISVFMVPEASKAEVAEIGQRLQAKVSGEVRFVAKDAALKSLQASADFGDLLAGLSRNPLPDAFVLRPAKATAAELDALAQSLRNWPKVAQVQLDSAWVQRLEALLRFGRLFVGLLAAVLGAGLLAVVFNTIRLQVLGRREEVELALLIGATPDFVARPFVWFGIVEGLFGGLLALGLVSGALALLAGPAAEIGTLYGGNFSLGRLNPVIAAGVLAAGALLGWIAGWLSTRTLGRS